MRISDWSSDVCSSDLSIGGLDKKWKAFVENEGDSVDRIRTEIAEIAQQTGMALPEFRRIVNMVQKGEREARIAKKEMVEANLRLEIGRASCRERVCQYV